MEPVTLSSSLEQIGLYVQVGFKRSALDAWEIGRALKIAKGKAGKAKFGKWKKTYLPFVSDSTIARYMRIAELPKDAIEGERLSDVYKILEGENRKPERKAPVAVATFQAVNPVVPSDQPDANPVLDLKSEHSGNIVFTPVDASVPFLVSNHATADFDGEEPATVPEQDEQTPAPGIRYTFSATILLTTEEDVATLEDLIVANQVRWLLRNGSGKTLAKVKVEGVPTLERTEVSIETA